MIPDSASPRRPPIVSIPDAARTTNLQSQALMLSPAITSPVAADSYWHRRHWPHPSPSPLPSRSVSSVRSDPAQSCRAPARLGLSRSSPSVSVAGARPRAEATMHPGPRAACRTDPRIHPGASSRSCRGSACGRSAMLSHRSWIETRTHLRCGD